MPLARRASAGAAAVQAAAGERARPQADRGRRGLVPQRCTACSWPMAFRVEYSILVVLRRALTRGWIVEYSILVVLRRA